MKKETTEHRARREQREDLMASMYMAGATTFWLADHFDRDEETIRRFLRKRGLRRAAITTPDHHRIPVEYLLRQAGLL